MKDLLAKLEEFRSKEKELRQEIALHRKLLINETAQFWIAYRVVAQDRDSAIGYVVGLSPYERTNIGGFSFAIRSSTPVKIDYDDRIDEEIYTEILEVGVLYAYMMTEHYDAAHEKRLVSFKIFKSRREAELDNEKLLSITMKSFGK